MREDNLKKCPGKQSSKMRPLTEEESKAVFTKLSNYIVRLASSILTRLPLSDTITTITTGQKPRSPY